MVSFIPLQQLDFFKEFSIFAAFEAFEDLQSVGPFKGLLSVQGSKGCKGLREFKSFEEFRVFLSRLQGLSYYKDFKLLLALEDSENLRNEIEQTQDLATEVRKMVSISKPPLLIAQPFIDRKFFPDP
jgi:hypothetical protein